jgi:hypothetical protein
MTGLSIARRNKIKVLFGWYEEMGERLRTNLKYLRPKFEGGRAMQKRITLSVAVGILLLAGLQPGISAHQDNARQTEPLGVPILWEEPTNISTRDLFNGPGGEAMKPDLTRLTLIEEKASGARSQKMRVKDGSNREWQVKIGDEARAEVAASRLLWAVGYFTDTTYLVPSAQIEGKGSFKNLRFEARSKSIKRLTEWSWDDNPFLNAKELQGLRVLLALVDNWNLKNENNRILLIRDDESGRNELRYILSDFDIRLDRTLAGPSFWYQLDGKKKPAEAGFATSRNGFVDLNYLGSHKERLQGISVASANWIGGLLTRLSSQQLSDALRAGNFTSEESRAILVVLQSRISELTKLK